MAQQTPVQVWALPFTAEGTIALCANAKIVEATSTMVDWQPYAAVGNSGPRVALTHFQAVYAFGTRFIIGPAAADTLAAANRNLLRTKFSDGFWTTVFTEYTEKGLPEVLEAEGATEIKQLHEAITNLEIDPTQLHITAASWDHADPFDRPAVPERRAAQGRPRVPAVPALAGPAALDFINMTSLTSLQHPFEACPWRVIARLIGALGPCLSDAARRSPMSTVSVVAAALRAALSERYGTDSTSLFAINLKNFMDANLLPDFLRAVGCTEDELRTELIDTLIFARPNGAAYVLRSRLHLVQNR